MKNFRRSKIASSLMSTLQNVDNTHIFLVVQPSYLLVLQICNFLQCYCRWPSEATAFCSILVTRLEEKSVQKSGLICTYFEKNLLLGFFFGNLKIWRWRRCWRQSIKPELMMKYLRIRITLSFTFLWPSNPPLLRCS